MGVRLRNRPRAAILAGWQREHGVARAVVFGITADHAFAAGALIASIRAHDPGFADDVVILHDGLTAAHEAAFLRLYPRCRFRPFGRAEVAARMGAAGTAVRLAPLYARFSALLFAKLELPALLDNYDQVLWLDADILVRGPLRPAWDFDALAWRPLPDGAFGRREKAFAALSDLRRDPATPLMNGGVIGAGRALRDRHGLGTGDLHALAALLLERSETTQVVELAWYLLAATRGVPVTALPLAFNHPVTTPGAAAAVAIHAIGAHKFWNATPLIHAYPDWADHQAAWVAAGGAPYDGPLTLAEVHPADPAEALKAAEMRDFWQDLFPALRPLLPPGLVADLRADRKYLRLFLHARPEAQHLRLVRLPNERRLGLEFHLPDRETRTVAAAVRRAVTGVRAEAGRDNALTVPLDRLGPALAAAVQALSLAPPQATSRA